MLDYAVITDADFREALDVGMIAHHQAVMAHGESTIDLAPPGRPRRGPVVFEGTPAQLVAARSTRAGQHLAAYVGA